MSLFDPEIHNRFKDAVTKMGDASFALKQYVDKLETKLWDVDRQLKERTAELTSTKTLLESASGDRDFYKRRFEESSEELRKMKLEAFGIDITATTKRPKNMLEALNMFGISVEELETSFLESKRLRDATRPNQA